MQEPLYNVVYLDMVTQKDIPALPTSAKRMIKIAIEKRLMINPIRFGKPLRYSLKGHRRLCTGDHRVVYRIATDNNVLIIAIEHRKD